MEIVNVEKKTFDDLLDRMERFMDSIETIYGNGKAKSMSGWLDNQYLPAHFADFTGQRCASVQQDQSQDFL